jgi:hypothetical protein
MIKSKSGMKPLRLKSQLPSSSNECINAIKTDLNVNENNFKNREKFILYAPNPEFLQVAS